MVTLEPITKDNYRECLKLEVFDEQKTFVASNVFSLAQAYVHSDIARPFAICADGAVVGFAMMNVELEAQDYGLWRFMIAREHQGKDYGKAAMALVIDYLKEQGAMTIRLSYEPENHVADRLYRSFGFLPTGEIDEGEIVMELRF